jgi:hypothetical protein
MPGVATADVNITAVVGMAFTTVNVSAAASFVAPAVVLIAVVAMVLFLISVSSTVFTTRLRAIP